GRVRRRPGGDRHGARTDDDLATAAGPAHRSGSPDPRRQNVGGAGELGPGPPVDHPPTVSQPGRHGDPALCGHRRRSNRAAPPAPPRVAARADLRIPVPFVAVYFVPGSLLPPPRTGP